MSHNPRWRMKGSVIAKLVIALVFVLVSCYVTRAQEIEAAADEASSAQTVEDTSPPLSEAAQTAIQVLEARNPQTATELVTAANVLRQAGAYDDAKAYLAKAADVATTDEQLAKVHSDLGTVSLIRISNDTSMTPEGRDFVFKVFGAAKRVRRDSQRLQQVIERLASDDEETQRVAIQELSRAGAYAVPALLDAFRNPPADVDTTKLSLAINSLGQSAEDALIACIGAPDTFIQLVAIRALQSAGTKRARNHLVRPSYSSEESIQKSARQSLLALGTKPPASSAEAARYLQRLTTAHLNGKPPVRPEYDNTLEMWTWNAEKSNVVPHRLTAEEAAAVTAARFARDAFELAPSQQTQQELLISQLQSDRMLGGWDNELPQGPGTATDFGMSRGPQALASALMHCLDKGYAASASGAAELLGNLMANTAGTGALAPLTRALHSPHRRVRYAAARALMKIDPRQSFTGSSTLFDALVELAQSKGVPRALVATPRRDIRDRVAGMLGGLGFDVLQANEGNPGLKEALRISDYDLVVLSDSTSRPTASETIQQLRKSPRGKLIPVILLAREDQASRTEALASLDKRVVTMPEFADEAALSDRLEDIEKLIGTDSVPPARRLLQASDAMGWLAHLAKYSKTYHWYDFMRARDAAIQGVGHPKLRDAAIDLLGYLGDEKSQKTLVQIAGRKGNSAELRQRAANSFAEAILRRGLMLRKSEVYAQYDRYNASENEDQQTQEILGQILDVIESQTTKPVTTNQVF